LNNVTILETSPEVEYIAVEERAGSVSSDCPDVTSFTYGTIEKKVALFQSRFNLII